MQRLSAQDASFLYAEVPATPMHVAFLSLFDAVPGQTPYDVVRRQVEQRLPHVPLLRKRVVPVPLGLHHPVLADDPRLELDRHVLRGTVPAPGGREQLQALAAELVTGPMDRSRPLWELHVLDGLEDGGFALLSKLHHAVIDGVSGMDLMSTLLTPEPTEAAAAPPRPLPPAGRLPSELELTTAAAADLARQPLRLARTVVSSSRERLGRLQRLPSPATAPPFVVPRSPFNAALTPRRSVAVVPLSLTSVRAVRKAFGTTVNDVVLTLVGGAVRSSLLARGGLPASSLVAMAPVSVRPAGQSGGFGNQVSAILVPLGTDLADPVERLRQVRSRTVAAKELHDAVAAPELMDWSVVAGPATMALAARTYSALRVADIARPPFNLVVSNVPGPREPLYLGPARMRTLHPFGPLGEGLGVNVSVVSYLDSLDFGVIACPDVVPDVDRIAAGLQDELDALVSAAASA